MYKMKLLAAILLLLVLSPDCYSQWIYSPTSINYRVEKIVKSGNTLFAGVSTSIFNGKVLKSTDNGSTWDSINVGFYFSSVFDIDCKGDYVLAGTYEDGLVYTSNLGQTWMQDDVSSSEHNGVFALGISGNVFFTYNNTIWPFYYSNDNGTNWNQSTGWSFSQPSTFYDNGNLFYMATYRGMYYSTNHGLNWIYPANTGLPTYPDSSVRLAGIYEFNNRIFTGSIDGIAYTTNNCQSWTNIAIDSSDYTTFSSFTSHNGILYSSVSALLQTEPTYGIYRSLDSGNTWTPFNTGLPFGTSVLSVMVSDGYLIASTSNNGVWRYNLNTVTGTGNNSNEIPKTFTLFQNYPNPFNPETVISYQLAVNSDVAINVYDVSGKIISTLVNEKQNAGTYSIKFNGSDLSSGIYYYTLNTGDFIQTRKMILVK